MATPHLQEALNNHDFKALSGANLCLFVTVIQR
jgi:hypothetical protein